MRHRGMSGLQWIVFTNVPGERDDAISMKQEDLIVCRCEGVRLGQIRDSIIYRGAQTVNEVKKLTRTGMGVCQGKTCVCLVEALLNDEPSLAKREAFCSRPPVRGVNVGWLAATADAYDYPSGPTRAVAVLSPDADE